jgi:glucose/arabinose dehydrogenase
MTPSLRTAVLIAALVTAASCGVADGAAGRKAQTTAQAPAPKGAMALKEEVLATGLVNPWSLAFLPDGAILVSERAGRIRVIRDGMLVTEPVSGTPTPFVKSQAGMFDILPHPDFAQNRTLFLSFAAGDASGNATRVVSAKFDGSALTEVTTIFETRDKKSTAAHYGARMALLPDRTLLIAVGDGFDHREKAQDLSSGFGKMVRINLDGTVPRDNPFAGRNALPETFSYGHRNQQGLAVDPQTGVIYETEHGPKGGDEINVLKAGANYGWPIATYGVDYSGAVISPFTDRPGTEQPIKYWVPSIAPSGLAVYRGSLFPEWSGDLLVGALSMASPALGGLHRIDMENGAIAGEERYLAGRRVREVRVGPDGAIYATTEDRKGAPVGEVIRLTPAN